VLRLALVAPRAFADRAAVANGVDTEVARRPGLPGA
jgi:hypothetical protein